LSALDEASVVVAVIVGVLEAASASIVELVSSSVELTASLSLDEAAMVLGGNPVMFHTSVSPTLSIFPLLVVFGGTNPPQ
jgi:hypothetical protein